MCFRYTKNILNIIFFFFSYLFVFVVIFENFVFPQLHKYKNLKQITISVDNDIEKLNKFNKVYQVTTIKLQLLVKVNSNKLIS